MQAPSAQKVLLVLGHGKPSGLCHHLLEAARQVLDEKGAACRVHDLLADGFDPILRLDPGEAHPTRRTSSGDRLLERYQEDVLWADAYIFIHPVWWFAPPAILKGWIDRVLIHEVAIRQRPPDSPEGLLSGRRALLVQTFNAQFTVDKLVMGGIAKQFWKRAVFASVGIKDFRRLAIYSANDLNEGKLEAHRQRLRRAAEQLVS